MKDLPKNSDDTIINKLIQARNSLPRKQKMLCNYLIENSERVGIMTVKELADRVGIGTTTVMTLTKRLGYDSFNDLKKDLHKASLQMGLSNWWHLKKSFENDDTAENTVKQVWEEVIRLLEMTINESFLANFNKTIQLMKNAKKINILGLRSSKVAANYLSYLLQEFSSKVNQISNDTEFLFDRLLLIDKDEVVIIFGHSPFTVQSIEAAKYCHKNGIKVILVTNYMSCPMTPYATVTLKVQASSEQYSIVPTISLIEAMVIEYGRQTSHHSIEHLEKLEKLLKDNNITTSE